MQSVWPDTVVEEGGLARNISLLRKSLGEEEGSRYIETIPKRGYRFVGEVREASGPDPVTQLPIPSTAASSNLSRGKVLGILVVVLVLFPLLAILWSRHPKPAAELHLTALTTNAAELPVVLLSDGTGEYGLIVDSFRGEQDLVVRPLDARLEISSVECDLTCVFILAGGVRRTLPSTARVMIAGMEIRNRLAPNVSAERRDGLQSRFGEQFRLYLTQMGVSAEIIDIVGRNSESRTATNLKSDDWIRLRIVSAAPL